jgi:hypothetical protein
MISGVSHKEDCMSKKKSGNGKSGAKSGAPKQFMRNTPMSRRPPRQPGR